MTDPATCPCATDGTLLDPPSAAIGLPASMDPAWYDPIIDGAQLALHWIGGALSSATSAMLSAVAPNAWWLVPSLAITLLAVALFLRGRTEVNVNVDRRPRSRPQFKSKRH